ncbi:hypothetical protein HHS_00540 [Candidatus Pantoea carbekii]|uniref:Uncharacterized protein n=1 Tax=Candidatus Pantoea carbekii TaxID=1235990 RepID=U3U705_9GAMM|nr:hypothetical protein HHS_00540 [Candidatus Pantoea carbekii]
MSVCGHGIKAITSAFQADDTGSIPVARFIIHTADADIAQLVEHTLGKGEVPSPILGISTMFMFYQFVNSLVAIDTIRLLIQCANVVSDILDSSKHKNHYNVKLYVNLDSHALVYVHYNLINIV